MSATVTSKGQMIGRNGRGPTGGGRSSRPLLINDVVYAETSIRYALFEDLDAMPAQAMIDIAPAPHSSPERPFSAIAPRAARERESCPTFSSVPTRRSKDGRCLRATPVAIAAIFPRLR